MSEANMTGGQEVLSKWAKVVRHARNLLWYLVDPVLYLGFLVVGLGAALAGPFWGLKWALCGLSFIAASAVLAIAHGSLGVQYLGGAAQQIERPPDSQHRRTGSVSTDWRN